MKFQQLLVQPSIEGMSRCAQLYESIFGMLNLHVHNCEVALRRLCQPDQLFRDAKSPPRIHVFTDVSANQHLAEAPPCLLLAWENGPYKCGGYHSGALL